MIYVISLGNYAKKALGKQVQQSSLNKICDFMNLDPDDTTMDTVMLGPSDVTSPPMLERLQNALENKHPDICVIFIYTNDAQADLLDNVYKKKVKKIKEAAIKEAFEEFVSDHKIRQGKQRMSSADFQSPGSDSIGQPLPVKKKSLFGRNKVVAPNPVQEEDEFPAYEGGEMPGDDELEASQIPMPPFGESEEDNFDDDSLAADFAANIKLNLDKPEEPPVENTEPPELDLNAMLDEFPTSNPTPAFEPAPPVQPLVNPLSPEAQVQQHVSDMSYTNIESTIANMKSFDDWEIFKNMMSRDNLTRRLIEENSEYVGVLNMMEVLDKRISTVWRNPALSAEQKFEQIKDIGLERATLKASSNSITVQKIISVISAIALSAKAVVDEKVNSINTSLYKITSDKAMLMNTEELDKMIDSRMKTQEDLLNMAKGIVELYKSMDSLVRDTCLNLDTGLPSDNAFINEMVKPIGTAMFQPQNTKELVNKLMLALQNNRVMTSQLETSVNAVIDLMFQLCNQDEEIIRYQQAKINMLQANRVEDVIIVQTLIKNCLRLYVGADNTGRTATALTWSGILSRRNNTLLIDLTGRSKLSDYGVNAISLRDFMLDRIEQQFCCVVSDHILAPDELQSMVDEIKTRLNYYAYVNVILAPEDVNGLDQLSVDAKTVSYITDCSTSSIKAMAKVVGSHTYENIARQLITIDTPVSPLIIADRIGVDTQITRMIMLPSISEIRSCAIKHEHTWEFNEVQKLFEESFR